MQGQGASADVTDTQLTTFMAPFGQLHCSYYISAPDDACSLHRDNHKLDNASLAGQAWLSYAYSFRFLRCGQHALCGRQHH